MNRKWLAAASAAILPFLAATYCSGKKITAKANSAPPYWEGSDASGAIVKGENCPIVVENEKLTLNIKSLPRSGQVAFDDYAAEAIAEYSFYNPTDLDVDMTLLFPFGVFPDYVPEGVSDEVSAVSVNGEIVEGKVRYSYASYDFDIDRDMARVLDEKKEDAFYREDMPVREYRLSMDASAEYGVSMKIKLCYNAKKTRVLFPAGSCARLSISGGDMYAYLPAGTVRGNSAVFYAVGDPIGEIDPMYGGDRAVLADSSVTERDLTFSELALSGMETGLHISEADWYNAFVDMLNDRSEKNGSVDCFSLSEKNLMRWYEYKMSIPSKGRAVNRVKAPLYPAIEGNKNPCYEYSYLLSPAAKWADFMGIAISINTPYYLSNASLDFARTDEEDGFSYQFERGALPQGELTFVLTEKEEMNSDFNRFGNDFLHPSLTWAFVTLTALAAVAAMITVVVVISLRKKKK